MRRGEGTRVSVDQVRDVGATSISFYTGRPLGPWAANVEKSALPLIALPVTSPRIPYSDGEKGLVAMPAPFLQRRRLAKSSVMAPSPRHYTGRGCRQAGEGQRQRCHTWPGIEPTAVLSPLAPEALPPFAKLRAVRKHRQEISSPYLHLGPACRIGFAKPTTGRRPCPDPANWHWSGGADVQRSHRQHWRM